MRGPEYEELYRGEWVHPNPSEDWLGLGRIQGRLLDLYEAG